MNGVPQRPRRAIADPVQHFVDEIDVAVQQLARGEIHRGGGPRAAVIGMRDRRLLGRDPNQALDFVVVSQRHREAAHDAAVSRRAIRILLIGEASGLERLLPTVDQGERAFGGQSNAPAIHLHPFHPAAGHVRRVEPVARKQGLAEQQGHRGVVIVGRVLGRRGEISDAIGERFADGIRRSQVLGRDAELIPRDKAQHGAPCTRDELWVSQVHCATT
jgi:hypothetical protein